MQYLALSVYGMSNAENTKSVACALRRLRGARRVEVTLEPGTATVRVDAAHLKVGQVQAAITAPGFSATLNYVGPDEQGLA